MIWVRPDGRCFLSLEDVISLEDIVEPALVRRDLYAEVDAGDVVAQRVLTERGFAVHRREHRYALPTRPGHRAMPDGFGVISAAEADVVRLRELDDALRQDVPGTTGWCNDPREFAAQTFGDPGFDPAMYLLAVVESTGDYAGLVRVWNRDGGPRLGLVGALRAHRRRGLVIALLTRVLDVLHRRGHAETTCEVDETNAASNALMTRLGARRIGGIVEWIRRAPP